MFTYITFFCVGLVGVQVFLALGSFICLSNLQENGADACVRDAQVTRRHILQVSTLQMTILLLYNNREKFTFQVSPPLPEFPLSERSCTKMSHRCSHLLLNVTFLPMSKQEIHEETDIPKNDLARVLQPLCDGKTEQRVLIKEPNSKEMHSGDIFMVNDKFNCKCRKFKVKSCEQGSNLSVFTSGSSSKSSVYSPKMLVQRKPQFQRRRHLTGWTKKGSTGLRQPSSGL